MIDRALAERIPVQSAVDHQAQRDLALADCPHAVMNPAGPKPCLGDHETVTLFGDQIGRGDADIVENDLAMPFWRQ